MASFYRQHMDVLSVKPRAWREAQGTALFARRRSRVAFLLVSFLWRRKEKKHGRAAFQRIKISGVTEGDSIT